MNLFYLIFLKEINPYFLENIQPNIIPITYDHIEPLLKLDNQQNNFKSKISINDDQFVPNETIVFAIPTKKSSSFKNFFEIINIFFYIFPLYPVIALLLIGSLDFCTYLKNKKLSQSHQQGQNNQHTQKDNDNENSHSESGNDSNTSKIKSNVQSMSNPTQNDSGEKTNFSPEDLL